MREGDGIIKFCNRILNVSPSPQQADLLMGVANFKPGGDKLGVSCRSGRGTGKTWSLAWAILWKLACFENALILGTAPTQRQLFEVLWANCQRFIDGSDLMRQMLEWQATRIRVVGGNENWHAIARTAKSAVNMAGLHAPHMLYAVEEASGIEDAILNTLISGMTEGDNQIVMVSQPRRPTGIFFDSHNRGRNRYTTLHFDSRESKFTSAAWLAHMTDMYGEDSPMFSVEVKGDFPEQGEFSLFRLHWLLDAIDRDPVEQPDEGVCIGVDVARFGADQSCLVARQGMHVLMIDTWHGNDTQQSAGMVIEHARALKDKGLRIKQIAVDVIGLGSGTFDRLAEEQSSGHSVLEDVDLIDVNVAESSSDKEKFQTLRDEVWFELSDRFKDGAVSYDKDVPRHMIERLNAELLPVEYKFTGKLQARKVESKEEMKRKIGHSPDIADGMGLAFHGEGTAAPMVAWV